jgi:hypothetical protein
MTVRTLLASLALSFAAIAPVSAFAADESAVYAKLAESRSPSVVTIKFVLKISMGGSDEERETETAGVMIESGGLVMASNLQLGGISESMRSFMSPGMSMTPKDIKVLVGDDTEGVEAKVIARDSELDLAWVQIEKKGDKTFAAIDFANAGKVAPGQTLYSVERLGKFFDRASTINDFRIGAVVTKPRKLYIPSERLSAGLGTPIFAADGTPVGVSVLQLPSKEEMEAEQNMMGSQRGLVILPAEEVVAATARAKEAAASGKPVDEPAPTAPADAPKEEMAEPKKEGDK